MSYVSSGILYVPDYVSGGSVPGSFYTSAFSSATVLSGGTYSPASVIAGGKITVNSGGKLEGSAVISSGGSIILQNGSLIGSGVSTPITIQSGGTLTIGNGAQQYTGTNYILSGGTIVASKQVGTHTWSTAGGTVILQSGATDTENNLVAGSASIIVSSGATLSNVTLQSGNALVVNSGGTLVQGTVNSGATAVFSAGATEAATLNGGTISAYNSPPEFDWGTSGGTLILKSGAVDTGEAPQAGAAIVVVESGATLSNAKLSSGNTLGISAGGQVLNAVVSSGAGVGVAGSLESGTVVSGGTIYVGGATGVAENTTVNGGVLSAQSGATLNSATISASSGNTSLNVIVDSGATMSAATFEAWSLGRVIAGGSAVNTVIDSRGGLGLQGSATGTTINTSGVLDIASGGHADNNTVTAGGEVYVESGGTLGDTSVASTGLVTVSNGGVLSGVITLQAGGSATLWNNAGGTVVLPTDANHGLTISGLENGGTVSTVISGFSGTAPGNSDSIDLAGVSADGVSYAYPSDDQVVITLANKETITLNIPGVKATGFELVSNGNGGALGEVCFLSGTMIKTPAGEVAVETLRLGDEVTAYVDGSLQSRRIVWAGKAHAEVRTHLADDQAGYPVRICKDAIVEGVPYKDMLITPEHCLFFSGRFVPVRMLVNGASIFYDTSITSYDYFHVETEQHSVLMADGMLTESYLDTGNRRTFSQSGSVVALGGTPQDWATDAAVPLSVDRAFVEPLFHKLAGRAEDVSDRQVPDKSAMTTNPDLHLITQTGAIVRPVSQKDGQYRFMLPPGVASVEIVSRASRPSDVIGPFVDDRRMLGVAIGKIHLMTANKTTRITAHLEQDKLAGWYAAEADYAWTSGHAHLPLPLMIRRSMSLLTLTVCAAGPYQQTDATPEPETAAYSA